MSDQHGGDVARIQPIGDLTQQFGVGLPPSLQILLNEGVYTRIKQLAQLMSQAKGITPEHLIGKGEACFAIINIALDAKLNPHFVARHTYQTPGGAIGYDGTLVHAMLETSGRFIGSPGLEYVGDWTKLIGKFRIAEGQKGGKYAVPTWTSDDATGLGVIVRWQVKGEPSVRVWPGEKEPFQLVQCFPLHSPLWATDPKTQIAYLAIRRFANQAAPGILGAAAFDEAELFGASDLARDVTPGANLDQPVSNGHAALDSQGWDIVDLDGLVSTFTNPGRALSGIEMLLNAAATHGLERLEGTWADNLETLQELIVVGVTGADEMMRVYADLKQELRAAPKDIPTAGMKEAAPGGQPQVHYFEQNEMMEQDQREQNGERQEDDRFPGDLAPGEKLGGGGPSDPPTADTGKTGPASAGKESTAPSAAAPASQQASASPPAPATGDPTSAGTSTQGLAAAQQQVPEGPAETQAGASTPTQAAPAVQGQSDATSGTSAAPGSGTQEPTARASQSSPGGPGRNATRTASRSEPAEPEHESKFIPTPAQILGKPDQHKMFLSVVLTARMRQQLTSNDMAWFLGDNAAAIEEAVGKVNGADRREWEDAVKAHWARISQLEAAGPR